MSIELPVTTRHRRDMTEKLLKATLSPNSHTLLKHECALAIGKINYYTSKTFLVICFYVLENTLLNKAEKDRIHVPPIA